MQPWKVDLLLYQTTDLANPYDHAHRLKSNPLFNLTQTKLQFTYIQLYLGQHVPTRLHLLTSNALEEEAQQLR